HDPGADEPGGVKGGVRHLRDRADRDRVSVPAEVFRTGNYGGCSKRIIMQAVGRKGPIAIENKKTRRFYCDEKELIKKAGAAARRYNGSRNVCGLRFRRE